MRVKNGVESSPANVVSGIAIPQVMADSDTTGLAGADKAAGMLAASFLSPKTSIRVAQQAAAAATSFSKAAQIKPTKRSIENEYTVSVICV